MLKIPERLLGRCVAVRSLVYDTTLWGRILEVGPESFRFTLISRPWLGIYTRRRRDYRFDRELFPEPRQDAG